jgi:hypothetical protein
MSVLRPEHRLAARCISGLRRMADPTGRHTTVLPATDSRASQRESAALRDERQLECRVCLKGASRIVTAAEGLRISNLRPVARGAITGAWPWRTQQP